MQKTVDTPSNLPAFGLALSLAGAVAPAVAAPVPGAEAKLPQPEVKQPAQPLQHFSFVQFSGVDFREIVPPPDRGRPSERPLAEQMTDLKLEEASFDAPVVSAATFNHALSKNSDAPAPSDGGAGIVAAAALPGLFGLRKSKNPDTRPAAEGGPSPDPEKRSGPAKPESRAAQLLWGDQEKSEQHAGFSPKRLGKALVDLVKGTWHVWEKIVSAVPVPEQIQKIIKYGVPVVAATCGVVWFGVVLQVADVTMRAFGGMIKPLASAAAFLVPMVTAKPILEGVQKLFRMEPTTGWKREAIIRPVQLALLGGATILVQSMGLAPVTYAAWAAASIGIGWAATKLFNNSTRATMTAVAAALAMPWAHVATMRSYEVTVKGAGPDPEVGAWNVTTDLSMGEHWAKVINPFKKQSPPSGGHGIVLLNRDVPLFVPPHRHANSFNGEFSALIGKKVEVTTVGTWLKMFGDKHQPTIVKYRVLDDAPPSATSVPATNAPAK